MRNIRLLPLSGVESGSVFHPQFTQRLRGFDAIVFDGWLQMDDNGYNPYTRPQTWSSRPTTGQSTQNCASISQDKCAAGVAAEYMVSLCNELKAIPWLTMPDTADAEVRINALL